jgi:hypothetical protein
VISEKKNKLLDTNSESSKNLQMQIPLTNKKSMKSRKLKENFKKARKRKKDRLEM